MQENQLHYSKACKKEGKISDRLFATQRPMDALCSKPNSFFPLSCKLLSKKTFSLTFLAPTRIIFFVCPFALSSCFSDKLPLFLKKRGACEKKEKNFYKKPRQAFLKKAEICLREKKAGRAIFILEELLQRDKRTKTKTEEVKALTKKLAEKSFYPLKNYDKALKYYSSLLDFPLKSREKFSAHYHIAKSFYYLQKRSQALIEIEKAFFEGISMEERKQALILKGGIFITQNQFDKASRLFQKQIENYPDHQDFFREYLAFIYESQKKFSLAVQELEKIEKPSAFLSLRIERLKERQSNQPGFL
ncbi:MAG: hypothetical protein OXJ52_03625 [Oligoflexia bacterium]|nr:hypothetical protein [Oligoflexia bacterium]